MLEDITEIEAIPLGIALGEKDSQHITKRGYLPLSLTCGTTIRVPMHIHPSANDTIISPEAIMYSTDSIHSWTQTGTPDGHGSVTFYSKDGRVLLSLNLGAKNRLYFYGVGSTCVGPAMSGAGPVSEAYSVETVDEKQQAPPAQTRSRKTPVTLGYQLDSELWSVRHGSPGETSMHELAKGRALGIPNGFRFHPFS